MKKYIITYIEYERGHLQDITKAFIDNYEIEATTKEEAYNKFEKKPYLDMDYIRILNIIELEELKKEGE